MDNPSLESSYRGVFDGRLGFGRQPALLLVDFINAYTTPGSPLYAAPVVAAVRETVAVLARAREQGVLVVYTRVLYSGHGQDGGLFVQKVPVLRRMVAGEPLAEIVPDLAPLPAEVIVVKQYASAFFGTALAATLTSQGVDTVLLTGCSTSGCIRATAVDGLQHGFRVIVPRECVADRHPEPHAANLFDINSKYGDVVAKAEVLDYLARRPAGRAA
ncbi:MAG: isochorismatase family protein [Anaerolineales bacterium]|nr:isochorismatase family protein [Anaerolineales bacterium]